ncbi:MAG: hypothetical protein AAFX81_10755 [Pseudomonadota bacterium]
MSAADLVFLPWLRRGAAGGVQAVDTLGADQPGIATTTVTLTVNASATPPVSVAVMGPGHVTGLEAQQVVRTDPVPGARGFEPNYFPLIELDEPSLPWLFTPAAADAEARLRPWLCLVVVRKQAGVRLDPPRLTPLPVLRITGPATPGAELPDLAESWAWAHAQVTGEVGQASLRTALEGHPDRSVARLICPRLMAPDTDYLACLVPCFELGRRAGLGLEIDTEHEARLEPAWMPDTASVELPVYHSWEFTTGAGGDFQSLAMLLRARPLPEGVGTQPIDVGESGLDVDLPPGTTVPMPGALQPLEAAPNGWADPAHQSAWEAALAPVLNAPAGISADDDPLLAPPLYGAAQAGLAALDPSQALRWFERLNLAPEYRAVARLGTCVVREMQEQLMASAWAQAAALAQANQRLRQIQFGCWLTTSLHGRHLARMAPGAALQVMAPMQARLQRVGATGPNATGGVAMQIAETGLEPTAFSTALRRIARPRGAISRRVHRLTSTAAGATTTGAATTADFFARALPAGSMLKSLQPNAVIARRIAAPPGPVTLERIAASLRPARSDITWAEMTSSNLTRMQGRPDFAFVPLGEPVPMTAGRDTLVGTATITMATRAMRTPNTILPGGRIPGIPKRPPPPPNRPVPPPSGSKLPPPRLRDNAAAKQFRQLAKAHLARFAPRRTVMAGTAVRSGSLDPAFVASLAEAAPRAVFAASARAAVLLPGPGRSDESALAEVGLSPAFPQPMAAPLAEIAQGLMLPGLDRVPPNTVVPLRTNAAFVAAFMVGLNTEMGRELVWRGYPADLSTTYFDRFWDAGGALDRPPDIDPIAGWDGRALDVGGGPEAFVMLLRSELLQRYPNAVIYASRPGLPREERQPIFAGGFEPDVRYVGFDIPADQIGGWSFVLQEHPSAPRFGIEVGEAPEGASHLAAPDTNAARIARRLRQMPVRITLPATVLLGSG